jgi:hypothetical protein
MAQKTELGWIISGLIDIGLRPVFETHIASPNATQIRYYENLGRIRRFPLKLKNLLHITLIV